MMVSTKYSNSFIGVIIFIFLVIQIDFVIDYSINI